MSTLFISTALSFSAQSVESPTKILVSPNILVTRQDSDLPHAETIVAVNPRNKKNLLGASIVFTRDVYGTTLKTYASRDGGQTWADTSFPNRFAFGSVDPQVAFGLHGTAYFISLDAGETFPIHFYRSEDGGFTWERPRMLRGGDHPQMVVDQSTGRFANRIYFTAMYGVRNLAVSRSEDDGRTFIGPVEVPNPRGFWILNLKPFVLSDGTLLVPYVVWEDTDGKQVRTARTQIEFVMSNDGGATFSAPVKVADTPSRSPLGTKLEGSFAKQSNYASFDVDPKSDQIYVVWCNDDAGKLRAFFSTSKDRGKTWSQPKAIDANIPAWADQYQTHLAVNKDGVIGVMWYDTRDCEKQDCYNLYFSASTDGGATFLPAKKVSSETSFPISSKNLTPFYGFVIPGKDSSEKRFRTAFGRWANGGDYLGFIADAEGAFRPFWIDSRNGVFQVFTTRIKVGKEEPLPANLQTISVRDKILLMSDPPEYDFAKKEAVVQIRLRNTSTENIYGAIKLELKKTINWRVIDANGKESETATIDFSKSLGDWKYLPAGAVSEPMKLRFKYDGLGTPLATPGFSFDVSGFLPATPLNK
jgi:hypothetical protein